MCHHDCGNLAAAAGGAAAVGSVALDWAAHGAGDVERGGGVVS